METGLLCDKVGFASCPGRGPRWIIGGSIGLTRICCVSCGRYQPVSLRHPFYKQICRATVGNGLVSCLVSSRFPFPRQGCCDGNEHHAYPVSA